MAPQLQNPTLVDYHGVGAEVLFVGPVTRQKYTFGGAIRQGYVDERDVPGMLQKRWIRGPYFTLAEASEDAEDAEGEDAGETETSEDAEAPAEEPAPRKATGKAAGKAAKGSK